MANTDNPNGFRPKGNLIRLQPYDADATGSTAIFIGDIVEVETDGGIIPATGGDTGILGASMEYSAASTASTDMPIADAVHQVFIGQDDASGTSAQASIGGNADHIAGAGSTTTLLSGHEIAISTLTTATAGLRILQLVNRPDNAFGAWSELEVEINEHALKSTTGI